jgi:outer membrane lipopolysaccharide assembly protein LptE/RlpB
MFKSLSENLIIIIIVAVWVFLSTACGYRFSGSGNLPSGVTAVFITIFENRTLETGLENVITEDIVYEFTRNNRAASRKNADAILSGVVRSMHTETISRAGQHTAIERRVTVSVDLRLTDVDGREIWSAKSVSANEAYEVASNKFETEQNKQDAISVLSKRLSAKIYDRLTNDF